MGTRWTVVALMALGGSLPARANEAASFDCCHVISPTEKAATPMTVRIAPLQDRRTTGAPPEEAARHAGVIRGGYGNAFKLLAQEPVLDILTEALADQLRALGHTVTTGDTGDADLVISGSTTALGVDISSYGTYKHDAVVDLVVEGRGQRTPVRLAVEAHDTTGSRLGMAGGLKDLARQWYGKAGIKYACAAAIERMMISVAVQLSDPGTAGHSLFVAGVSAEPDPAFAGCTRDTDCKGDRICVEAVCTDP